MPVTFSYSHQITGQTITFNQAKKEELLIIYLKFFENFLKRQIASSSTEFTYNDIIGLTNQKLALEQSSANMQNLTEQEIKAKNNSILISKNNTVLLNKLLLISKKIAKDPRYLQAQNGLVADTRSLRDFILANASLINPVLLHTAMKLLHELSLKSDRHYFETNFIGYPVTEDRLAILDKSRDVAVIQPKNLLSLNDPNFKLDNEECCQMSCCLM